MTGPLFSFLSPSLTHSFLVSVKIRVGKESSDLPNIPHIPSLKPIRRTPRQPIQLPNTLDTSLPNIELTLDRVPIPVEQPRPVPDEAVSHSVRGRGAGARESDRRSAVGVWAHVEARVFRDRDRGGGVRDYLAVGGGDWV